MTLIQNFLNKNEFEEQNSTIDSKIYGIGVNIASAAGKIYVINVIKVLLPMSAALKQEI